MNRIKEFYLKHKQIILYMVYGTATTIVNWVVYTVLVEALNLGMTVSNAIAWVLAVLFAFVTNKLFVFESHRLDFRALLSEAASFFCSRAISGVIDVFAPSLLYKIGVTFSFLGIKGFGAKLIVSVIVIVLNYLFSKFIVFRRKK